MAHAEQGRLGRRGWVLAAGGLLAVVLGGCAGSRTVEVSSSAFPPRTTPPPTTSEPGEKFQGAVAAIDLERGAFTVAVRIVWAPVLKAAEEERRVVVDPQTRWVPAAGGVPQLQKGEEVQVEAVALPDGTWEARRIQLFDID